MFEFFVEGTPMPQGSKNAYRRGGKVVLVESSKRLPAWRQAVAQAAKQAYEGEPLDEPLRCDVVFVMPKPKKPKFWAPAVVPDTDKLMRALGDALTDAKVIKDDSRIVHWDARKIYAAEGHPPGAHVRVVPADA